MADFAFNIAKGRAIELVTRVKNGDPAAARLYAIPVDVAAVTDATIKDLDDFAAIITAGVTERTTGGWARITLAAADITALSPDDVNDRYDADVIDLNFGAVTGGTAASTDVIICYASVGAPTNAQLLPVSQHDMAFTPDGSVLIDQVAVFYRAS